MRSGKADSKRSRSLIDVKCIKMQNFPRHALSRWNVETRFFEKKKKKGNLSSFDQIYSRLMQAAFFTYLQDDFHWDRMREIFIASPFSRGRNKIYFHLEMSRYRIFLFCEIFRKKKRLSTPLSSAIFPAGLSGPLAERVLWNRVNVILISCVSQVDAVKCV